VVSMTDISNAREVDLDERSETMQASTQDEKIMAAIGHATIIWPVVGILAPLVVWATQREKSQFVAFQALQAGVYHMTLILAGLACGVCYFCAYLGMIVGVIAMPLSMAFTLPAEGAPSSDLPPEAVIPMLLGFLAMIVVYVAIFGLLFLGLAVWAAYIGYGLYGAVANLQGKDFRYAILGSRLERYLEQT
jgi:uncharacterized Tic20 family protein